MRVVALVTFIISLVYLMVFLVGVTEEEMYLTDLLNMVLSIICCVLMYQGTLSVQSSQMGARNKTKYACFLLMTANFFDGLTYFWYHYNMESEFLHFAVRHCVYMGFLMLSYVWCQELVEQDLKTLKKRGKSYK